VTAWVVILEP
jgi:hypothetical protein